jgi:DNA-binding CsgD family transcriptional regulator
MAIGARLSDPFTSSDRRESRLTGQEQEILARSASGCSITAVAEALGLAPEAVRWTLASIIKRVGARSKIEAVMIAVRNGLIELPTDAARTDTDGSDYRASAVRPVMRLLQWGEDDRRNARGPLPLADTVGRMIELRRDQVADVDWAAT